MSMLMECEGCSTAYDVSKRKPGKKVRCPRCKSVMVVPERDADMEDSAVVKASKHLRASRGPDCKVHKTTTSEAICKLCKAPMCGRCLSPAPVDHACRACAKALELEGALPIDFGFLTTLRLAFGVFFKNIVRIFLWGLLALFVTVTLCGIPFIVGGLLLAGADGPGLFQELGAGLVIFAIMGYFILSRLTLLPAGCAVFVDDSLRKRREVGAFAHAWRRVTNRAGSLLLICSIYGLLGALITLFGLVVYFYSAQAMGGLEWIDGKLVGNTAPVFVLAFVLSTGLLFVAVGLGLAVPITVLEQRSAFESLSRAWELAQQRFWTLTAIVLAFFVIFALVSVLATIVNNLLGIGLVGVFLTFLVDLFWPALLTVAYHGLAAEQAGVLGRGK